ncbi:MAG: hypothetical protein ACM3MK_03335 [Chitinophagales bacterium]
MKKRKVIISIVFTLLLLLMTTTSAFAWDDCKKGEVNCTRPCGDYVDTNGNQICDHSESEPQSDSLLSNTPFMLALGTVIVGGTGLLIRKRGD